MNKYTEIVILKNEKGEITSIILVAKNNSSAIKFCRTFPGAYQHGYGRVRLENDALIFEQSHGRETSECSHSLHDKEIDLIQELLNDGINVEFAGSANPGFRLVRAVSGTA